MMLKQEGAEEIGIYLSKVTLFQESIEEDIRNSSVKLFEAEVENTDTKYTVDKEFALSPFLKIAGVLHSVGAIFSKLVCH